MLPQKLDRALQLFGEAVNFVGGGGETQAGPGCTRQPVMAMQGLGAVVAAADADAGRIEQGGDVVGVQALHMEGGQRCPVGLLLGRRPEDAQPIEIGRAHV